MNQLLEIGFEFAGQWQLEGDRLTFELIRHAAQRNVLYAFVCDGEVKYVGKTVRPLSARMGGYKTPGNSQTTNIKGHERIRRLLAAGAAVEIFVLPDNGLLHYGQFHVNLAAGLEDDIIRVVNPEWNGGSKEPVFEEPEAAAEPSVPAPSKAEFEVTLHPTYVKTGFVNVRVADQDLIGGDGETIEIFLGDAAQPILGHINRSANPNHTPRVMGGTEVRDWFQANANVMDRITVQVLSPTSIRLISGRR